MSEFTPFIKKLRDLLPLSGVIARFIKIKRHGHEFQACCPFHEEKTPSFTINDPKQFYHCFGCGAHGDILRFMMDYHKLPFMEALKQLCEMAGIALPAITQKKINHKDTHERLFSLLEEATLFFQKNLAKNTLAQNYLTQRSLGAEVIQNYRLGFATQDLVPHLIAKGFSTSEVIQAGLAIEGSVSQQILPRFRDRLMIPIHDTKGRVIAFGGRSLHKDQQPKYMNSPETELFHKKMTLFGLNNIKNVSENRPLIVVEGYFDAITAQINGFNAVAPLGTALTTEQMQILWRYSYTPFLCFDGDSAGHKAMIRAAYHALPLLKPGYSFQFITLPSGEDPDSLLRGKGAAAFASFLPHAKPMITILCDQYTQKTHLEIPEIKAQIKQDFLKSIETIEDKDIRGFYKQAFYARIFESTQKNHSAPSKTLINTPKEITMPDSGPLAQKILLVTLLNHPTLIPTIVEELVRVVFEGEEEKELVQTLIESQCGDEGLATKAQIALETNALVTTLKKDASLMAIAPFSKEAATTEEAEAGFLDVWQRYNVRMGLEKALDDYKNKLKEHWDIQTWNGLKQIQTDLQDFSLLKEIL